MASEHTTSADISLARCVSHSRRACDTKAMVGAANRTRPSSGTIRSASLQRRERLARAARHHQPAAVVALRHQAVAGGVDGLLLQRLRMALCGGRPLELADRVVEEVQEVDAGDARLPARYGALRRRVPGAGGDDPAQSEGRVRGLAQEAVDGGLADDGVLRMALALDGDAGAVGLNGNEVDAVIAAVEARQLLAVRPIAPRPYPRHVEFGVVAHRGHEQVLEPPAPAPPR